jgi:hypothetical protein
MVREATIASIRFAIQRMMGRSSFGDENTNAAKHVPRDIMVIKTLHSMHRLPHVNSTFRAITAS